MTESSRLKITILGSGTSTGVPMPACDCSVCQSSNPRNKRLRPSALVTHNGRNYLIDAGADFRQQALREEIPSIDALLITHAHADHILGLDDLRCYTFRQDDPLPCYGSAGTLEQVKRIFFYIFERDPSYIGGGVAKLALHALEPFREFSLGDLKVTPFPLVHGHLTVFGYRFGNFAYATDCNALPAETMEFLKGTEVMVLDGLRQLPHNTHLSIDQAIDVASRMGIKKLYLIHMSHAVDYDTVSAQLPDWVSLCYDGLQITP